MAHPKRKQSKTRTAKRRTHDKAVAPTIAICPNCGAWHVYHTVSKIKRSHMDILEITRKQDPLYPTFEQIYTASFPLFEQRTEEQQEQAFQSPNYHLVVYLKDNLFIGFISYWDFSTYVYIEHFAIHENFRVYCWRILINA